MSVTSVTVVVFIVVTSNIRIIFFKNDAESNYIENMLTLINIAVFMFSFD
jgi:hypothetical protein